MYEACKNGETKVAQLLLVCCNSEESGLNTKDEEQAVGRRNGFYYCLL